VPAFAANGWSVELNRPFAGALVPASRYRQDARVSAVMVEVNRRLYLHEADATRRPDFDAVAAQVRACWGRAVEASGWGERGPVGASLASRLPVGASLLATLHSS
jgi:N-formylglutamate amidohydrolase